MKNNTAFLLGANRFNKASPSSTDCYSSTVTSEGAHHVSVDFIAMSVVFVWTHCLKVQVCGAVYSCVRHIEFLIGFMMAHAILKTRKMSLACLPQVQL